MRRLRVPPHSPDARMKEPTSPMERTLVLVKPDGMQRGLIGEILGRFERKGLKVVGMRMLSVPLEMAERHYAVHADRHFYAGLVEFIISGPVAAIALEGPDAIATVRRLVGKTMPNEAEPGTIRGDLGISGLRNLIHASDAADTARDELALWFADDGLISYERAVDAWIVAAEPPRT
jgi:nucleoside-diphosphate kinase